MKKLIVALMFLSSVVFADVVTRIGMTTQSGDITDTAKAPVPPYTIEDTGTYKEKGVNIAGGLEFYDGGQAGVRALLEYNKVSGDMSIAGVTDSIKSSEFLITGEIFFMVDELFKPMVTASLGKGSTQLDTLDIDYATVKVGVGATGQFNNNFGYYAKIERSAREYQEIKYLVSGIPVTETIETDATVFTAGLQITF